MWKEVIFLLAWLNINFVMALVEEKNPSMDSKPWSVYNVHRHSPPHILRSKCYLLEVYEPKLNPKWTSFPRACHGPGEVKLDLSFSPITRAGEVLIQWSLYMKGVACMMCHWAIELWEIAQIGVAPTVHLQRGREAARLRTRHSPALSTTQDQKPNCIMTGGTPDCGPHPGGTPPALGWSVIAVKSSRGGGVGRGRHGRTSDENTSKCHFFRLCQKLKKTLKMFLQE
jgi:hypothetical protein